MAYLFDLFLFFFFFFLFSCHDLGSKFSAVMVVFPAVL